MSGTEIVPPAASSAPAPSAPAAAPTQRVQTADSAPCLAGQVKANRNTKIYHVPSSRDYAKTKANVQCFDSEQQAQAAGYRRAEQ